MVCLGFEPGRQDGRCERIHGATAAPCYILFGATTFSLQLVIPLMNISYWTKSTERLLPTPDDHAHFYPITICW